MSFEQYAQGAQVAMQRGNQVEAETSLRQAVELAQRELGAAANKDDRVAAIYNNLGMCLRNQGKYADAESAFKRALEIRQAALGPLHANEVVILENYAKLLRQCNRAPEAEKLEKRALGIMRR